MSERITPERLSEATLERWREFAKEKDAPGPVALNALRRALWNATHALEAAYTRLDTRPALPEGSGAALIAAERQRQVEVEGWTPEHDAHHVDRELAYAAEGYIEHYINPDEIDESGTPVYWPWDREYWKPSADPIRNLTKAGALIAAEIDRLRAAPGESPVPESGPDGT